MSQRMIDERVAHRFIVIACVVALFGGLATGITAFTGAYGFTLFNLVDVALFFGMAFGIYRKSRTCALIMFVYHLGNRFDMYVRTGNGRLAFGFFPVAYAGAYFLGILGTFAAHAIRNERREADVASQAGQRSSVGLG